jgi:hypothetical protein
MARYGESCNAAASPFGLLGITPGTSINSLNGHVFLQVAGVDISLTFSLQCVNMTVVALLFHQNTCTDS